MRTTAEKKFHHCDAAMRYNVSHGEVVLIIDIGAMFQQESSDVATLIACCFCEPVVLLDNPPTRLDRTTDKIEVTMLTCMAKARFTRNSQPRISRRLQTISKITSGRARSIQVPLQ
jgi:hypothetical protein